MNTKILLFTGISFLFAACKNSSQSNKVSELSSKEREIYMEKGKQIAAETFTSLSQQLQKAVKEGGIPNAIQYCNLAALPITDSLAQKHKAIIRRTSLKTRNPKNAPTTTEQLVLKEYAEKSAKEMELKPLVKNHDRQTIAFYAPIMVNKFCLNCHGEAGSTLTIANDQLIKKYYPQDKATGYINGDFRGMWSIQIAKN